VTLAEQTRRLASLAVLLLAGLASLATSESPLAEDVARGESLVSADVSSIGATINYRAGSEPYESAEIDFGVATGSDRSSGGGLQAQITFSDAAATDDWDPMPLTFPLPTDDCVPRCQVRLTIRMRTVSEAAGNVVVPWRLHGVAFGYDALMDITMDADSVAGFSRGDLMLQGALVGLGLAALAMILIRVVSTGGDKLALALLTGIAGVVLVVSGAYVATGLPLGLTTGWVGITSLVSGLVVLLGCAARWHDRHQASFWAVPIMLVLAPVALSIFTLSGAFRPVDAQVALVGIGFAGFVAVVLAVAYILMARRRVRFADRTWTVLFLTGLVVLVSGAWSYLVALDRVEYDVVILLPMLWISLLAVGAMHTWLRGDVVLPVVAVALLIVGAIIALGVAFVFSFGFFKPAPSLPMMLSSCVVIAVAGLAIGVATSKRPEALASSD